MGMSLRGALTMPGYDSSWGIWAERDGEGKFSLESPARYGRRIFENGGRLDSMEFVCSGDWVWDMRVRWLDGAQEDWDWDDGFMEYILDILNS